MSREGEQANLKQLTARWRSGDGDALVEIFDRYSAELHRLARRRIQFLRMGTLADADDILQSLALALLRHPPQCQFDRRGALIAYLRRAVRNETSRVARRHATGEISAADPTVLDRRAVQTREDDPADAAITRDVLELIEQRLAKDEWTLYFLRRGGSSWQAIAQRLAVTADAARQRYQRLGTRLRSGLDLEQQSTVRLTRGGVALAR